MCCNCCGVTQRKAWVFGFGTFFLALGITLMVIWHDVALNIMHNNLVLKEGSESYENWVDAPVPIYLEFNMFNWTNPEHIRNPNVKPHFEEVGPYVFLEKHHKQNITFYDNYTVSYFEKRTWHFDEERSNGKLDDPITMVHVISATVADEMRKKRGIIKKAVNFMLNHEGGKLYTTKPVGELLFDGYQDDLIDFLRLFNTSLIDMPYSRFGFLVDRNESVEYDGLFTIHTGVDNLDNLGQISNWNYRNESGFYELPCGKVNGTTGDLFPPHLDKDQEITIYATDACRFMNLAPNGTYSRFGIDAVKWVGTIETLDSGENYPNQKCFCDARLEECPKTGVVDCKKCRDNAPIYASFPHFYLADPSYLEAVSGLHPDQEKHEFTLAVEPFTGIPLQVNGRLQINMMLEPDDSFDIFRGVQKVMMPLFWFEQKAGLDKKLAKKTKLAMNLGDYGFYTGIALTVVGGIFFIVGIILTITKSWKKPDPSEDEAILDN